MKLRCPSCDQTIDVNDINLVTNIAKCVHCNSVHTASHLVKDQLEDDNYSSRSSNPPDGSKIKIKKGRRDEYEIFYAPKGFTLAILPQLGFSIFWLGFITFWTWGASQGSTFFALFSIPFWIIGISMLVGIFNSIKESQFIKISKYEVMIEKKRPVFSKKYKFTYREIHSVKMYSNKITPFNVNQIFSNFKFSFNKRNQSEVISPAFLTGAKTITFFEQANEAEQEWTVQFLDRLVREIKSQLD